MSCLWANKSTNQKSFSVYVYWKCSGYLLNPSYPHGYKIWRKNHQLSEGLWFFGLHIEQTPNFHTCRALDVPSLLSITCFYYDLPCSTMFYSVLLCFVLIMCSIMCYYVFVLLCSTMFQYVLVCSIMFYYVLFYYVLFYYVLLRSIMIDYGLHDVHFTQDFSH